MNLWDWVEDALDVAAWLTRSWLGWFLLTGLGALAAMLALHAT